MLRSCRRCSEHGLVELLDSILPLVDEVGANPNRLVDFNALLGRYSPIDCLLNTLFRRLQDRFRRIPLVFHHQALVQSQLACCFQL